MIHNRLNLLSIITTLLSWSVLVSVSYWLFCPYKVIEFEQTPFPIVNENKSVKQGDNLVYEVEYCKYIDKVAEVSRSFNDGIIYSLPPVIGNREVGCKDNNVYVEVPKGLPVGKYTLQVVFRYKVNPIRTMEYTIFTEPFTVTK